MENLTAEQILEGNRAIAEFMGYENQCEDWCGSNILDIDELFGEPGMRPFNPDKRWDDIMPVVDKIESLSTEYESYEVAIAKWGCTIEKHWNSLHGRVSNSIASDYSNNKKQAVYQAVLAFIQWLSTHIKTENSPDIYTKD